MVYARNENGLMAENKRGAQRLGATHFKHINLRMNNLRKLLMCISCNESYSLITNVNYFVI